MSTPILEASADFVDAISLGYAVEMRGDNFSYLSKMRMFAILTQAGFEPKAIESGKLNGNYLDQSGHATGETFEINPHFPYKVINQENEDDYFATGWLSCLFGFVRRYLDGSKNSLNNEEKQELINLVAKEIKRAIPFTPIQITRDGDLLCEAPPSGNLWGGYFVDHMRDKDKIEGSSMVHKFCYGFMNRLRATEDLDVLVCKLCFLRVLFPKEIVQYGQLRYWFEFGKLIE